MRPIQTLLVPVDFSETSEAALEYAVSLAQPLGARLVVMHAYELPIYGFPDGALVASVEVATRLMNSAQVGLDAMVARWRGESRIDTVLRQGVPWEEVQAVAEDVGADLIVIGTHGRRGIARALLGSVAEKILRTSTRPVLTVHAEHRARRGQSTYRAPASSSMPESPVRK
ncbi:MAG TPA: universal stress protein [Polyangiaceae bacterium]|jgi:nucleotide-binding universal stress UspA family protein